MTIQLETSTKKQNFSVTREVLAFGYPDALEGKILELVRYTIPSGVVLSPHSHPGLQIEQIELGVLTYTVIEGTAKVIRANKHTQSLQAGQTTYLYSGDSLTEPAGMVHSARNETNSPIILYSSSLFEINQPKAMAATILST
ncbi:cupin domain-containing protein [Myxosarcina sp. GI1(2024)]